MHSNRCSATGTFFGPTTSCTGRLITKAAAPSTGLSSGPAAAGSAQNFALPFALAISAPPNAGHDTNYRESQSTEQFAATAEVVLAGQAAFAEELLARLDFWCARGQPRRRYYNPALSDGSQAATMSPTVEAETGASDAFAAPNTTSSDLKGEMPLKLLFTQVGVIQFRPVEAAVYRYGKDQHLLLEALADATEVVICSVRERSPRCGRHDRAGGGAQSQLNGDSAFDDSTQSDNDDDDDDDKDLFFWGRYEDVAMAASVRWAQGEAEAEADGNDASATGHAPTFRQAARRSLSTRERHQRRNERLKMEFYLAQSQRLDAILVDHRTANPIAALVLLQTKRRPHAARAGAPIVQETAFIVHSFSHYVVPLLRHLREEKVLMVDMDRTLVDNAILAGEGLTYMPRPQGNGTAGEDQLHFELRKEVEYIAAGATCQGVRTETIYVRPGVRQLLRCFAVEWGIPVVLVTKSSRRRTEAILSQALDPTGELFPPGRGRIFAAELLLRAAAGKASSGEAPPLSAPPPDLSGEEIDRWQSQESLVQARKCTTAVLQELERVSTHGQGPARSPPRARTVAVLDDAPQVWVEADWPCTVAVAPYTLDRVDPQDYFTPSGLVASLLLSQLYRGRCVRRPTPYSEEDERQRSSGAVRQGGCGGASGPVPDSRFAPLRNSVVDDDNADDVATVSRRSALEMPCAGRLSLPADRDPSAAPSPNNDAPATDEMLRAEEAVVEEFHEWRERSRWATADVEDVTPL
ncbi:uncharacterized protein Tco025E_04910 [Trypanosoma conorhini]|uniref:Uncharacterized protein n=1 Tax=Trypanosoma conorhini TaxID=83891 RepID=A0A422PI58_9TRYP|nr:uncharacterized protein Tco025E_04910 [Trypanosoma conorhini]RNF17371.1 hypothetical protein Tco025E_04910 [Trypanosoma conorhini]